MRILLVAATSFEVAPTYEWLQLQCQQIGNHQFKKDFLEVQVLLTGVGLPLTTYALTKAIQSNKAFDLLINAGIAGALNRELEIGQVIQVESDQFADLGVEEADGSFTSMHALDLLPTNQYPFSGGKLLNPQADSTFLPTVSAISVNKVHGYSPSIERLKAQYDADIESMEGAAFFYVGLMEQVKFLQIRSISNYVEARNRENWNIPLALKNLNEVLIGMLQALSQ
ncbi:MAG: futalosine hydrolase [Saprospiraceae bacterium]|nr:futalosine hydrolase [Saprospiraceae bacterium]